MTEGKLREPYRELEPLSVVICREARGRAWVNLFEK